MTFEASRWTAWAGWGVACALVAGALAGCRRPSHIEPSRAFIELSTERLQLETVEGAVTQQAFEVVVTNGGGQVLAVPDAAIRYAGPEAGWLAAEVNGDASAYRLAVLPRGLEGLPAGEYGATISLTALGAANSPATISVELTVRPAAMRWEEGPPLATAAPRLGAVALPDGGALVAAGPDGGSYAGAALERMEAASRTWSSLGGLPTGRRLTTLQDGRVLARGGGSYEIFDPATGEPSWTGNLAYLYPDATAVPLLDGRVLLGCQQVFDPGTGTSVEVQGWRVCEEAIRLEDGRVLAHELSYAADADGTWHGVSQFHLYDPRTNALADVGGLRHPRLRFGLAMLPGGRVLAIGGWDADLVDLDRHDMEHPRQMLLSGEALASTEVYDPGKREWSSGPTLHVPRAELAADVAALPDGKVLVVGGCTSPGALYQPLDPDDCTETSFVEVHDPAAAAQGWTLAGSLSAPRARHAVVVLADGSVIAVGGETREQADPRAPVRSPAGYPERWMPPSP